VPAQRVAHQPRPPHRPGKRFNRYCCQNRPDLAAGTASAACACWTLLVTGIRSGGPAKDWHTDAESLLAHEYGECNSDGRNRIPKPWCAALNGYGNGRTVAANLAFVVTATAIVLVRE
jgi:hypothetical protein